VSLFEAAELDGHEDVVFLTDQPTRLRAIVAVRDTTLGPALGGCRVAIQGIGNVVGRLCQALAAEGATLIVTDPTTRAGRGGSCGARCKHGRARGQARTASRWLPDGNQSRPFTVPEA
jgi:glutamate dehydrogenase/leucine dehydrogenase